jgi:CRP/FNR family transcriptional regulator
MRSQSYTTIRPDGAPLSKGEIASSLLVDRLQHRAQRQTLPAGASLFAEDDLVDRVLVLASGWAMKSKSLIDGRRQILDFALPGDVLGSLRGTRSSHAVEMLTAGEVVGVPADLFVTMSESSPPLALEIARRFESAELRAYERIAAIGCRSAHLRVSRLLAELAVRQAPSGPAIAPLRLTCPLRQIHIADALGLRIETVCRVLGRLSRAGIAQLRGGELVVDDLAALRREGERESPPPAGKVFDLRPAAVLHAA